MYSPDSGASVLVGLVTILCLLGWIPILVFFKNKAHLEEIRGKYGLDREAMAQAIAELQREVQMLRDNTTRLDASVPSGVTSAEGRAEPPTIIANRGCP